MTHVELPTSLFVSKASTINYVGYIMYLSSSIAQSPAIFLHKSLENFAGSIPLSAQPPTPSATAITFEVIAAASSPPLSLLFMWGLRNTPDLNLLVLRLDSSWVTSAEEKVLEPNMLSLLATVLL